MQTALPNLRFLLTILLILHAIRSMQLIPKKRFLFSCKSTLVFSLCFLNIAKSDGIKVIFNKDLQFQCSTDWKWYTSIIRVFIIASMERNQYHKRRILDMPFKFKQCSSEKMLMGFLWFYWRLPPVADASMVLWG